MRENISNKYKRINIGKIITEERIRRGFRSSFYKWRKEWGNGGEKGGKRRYLS